MAGLEIMFKLGLKNRNHSPIGVDIGYSSVKMLQLATDNGAISVAAAARLAVEPSVRSEPEKKRQFVVGAVRDALEKGGFAGNDAICCIPNNKLRITSFRLGQAESGSIEQAVQKEAVGRFGLDSEKDAISYLVAGAVNQGEEIKNEVILLASQPDHKRAD